MREGVRESERKREGGGRERRGWIQRESERKRGGREGDNERNRNKEVGGKEQEKEKERGGERKCESEKTRDLGGG